MRQVNFLISAFEAELPSLPRPPSPSCLPFSIFAGKRALTPQTSSRRSFHFKLKESYAECTSSLDRPFHRMLLQPFALDNPMLLAVLAHTSKLASQNFRRNLGPQHEQLFRLLLEQPKLRKLTLSEALALLRCCAQGVLGPSRPPGSH